MQEKEATVNKDAGHAAKERARLIRDLTEESDRDRRDAEEYRKRLQSLRGLSKWLPRPAAARG